MSIDIGYTTADGETTDGWSGSDASHERASIEALTGTAGRRRQEVWNYVRMSGLRGVTWAEVADAMNLHHGQATGALSNLHKAGKIVRLREKRGKSSIYVLPHAADGRETVAHGRRRGAVAPESTEVAPGATLSADALTRAEERGWQNGYDEGVEAGKAMPAPADEQLLMKRYEGGRVRGAADERERLNKYLTALLGEYRRVTPKTITGHGGKCWMHHPVCAVEMVQRAVNVE